jgi:hypothetical protein
MTPEDTEDKTEPNLFRGTLESAKTTVANCGTTVHSGFGSPLDAIASPLANGGWVCTEADTWVAEMKEQCAGITEAFDDALSTIQTRIGTEPDKVPENDYRGNAWPRQWRMQRLY